MARSHHDDDYEEMLVEYFLEVRRTKTDNADRCDPEHDAPPRMDGRSGGTEQLASRA